MIKAGISENQIDTFGDVLEKSVKDFTETKFESQQSVVCDLGGFKKWLKSKGRSDNCINTYVKGIELFYNRYKEMNIETLSEYEKEIGSKMNPKTVNLRICGMNAYFKYTGFTDYEFRKVKVEKKTFCDNVISENQFNQLIEFAKKNAPKVWLIAKVIAGTGVRVSELIELKTKDLDKGYADIVGKGNKVRRIYFTDKLVEEIKDKCGKEYIVENRYGTAMSTRGVSDLLKKAGKKAGLPNEVMHPHSFRHYFAKQFMKKTQDISLLSDILGHSNISTTAIYTRLSTEEQQKQMNNLVNW